MPYVSTHRKAHESFQQPRTGTLRVWRYLDLARLVHILSGSVLPLVRLTLLDDDFEGSITRGDYERWSRDDPANAAQLAKIRKTVLREIFVSSWYGGTHESEAMWRLYCGGGRQGVALQTTYSRLDASLRPDLLLGKIRYLDFESKTRPLNFLNILSSPMYKRTAFAHEREVRVVMWRPASAAKLKVDLRAVAPARALAVDVPWKPEVALEAIYISPYAEQWYADVVRRTIERFAPALSKKVRWSSMKGVPRF
jgi:hypothetical protein